MYSMSQKDLIPRHFLAFITILQINILLCPLDGILMTSILGRDQTKCGLILITTAKLLTHKMSKSNFSVCAGYLAMGNLLLCITCYA